MADNPETQTVEEPPKHYCRTCGHAKESHDLDFRGDPKEARVRYDSGVYVCQHMTGDHSSHHCICVGWNSWV